MTVDLRQTALDRASVLGEADATLRSDSLRQLYASYSDRQDRSDPRLSLLAAEDLSGLRSAVIAVLTVDPLRDEAVEYAQRLSAAGVPIELLEFGNLTRSFATLAALVPAAARPFERRLTTLYELLAQP